MEPSPVKFNVDYPEKLSRGQLLLKTFLGYFYIIIPHGFCLFFVGIAAAVMQFIAWWVILFTGKYPKGTFDFMVRYIRWGLRVNAYMGLMTDKMPPFSGRE